jgi:hypothetical protein
VLACSPTVPSRAKAGCCRAACLGHAQSLHSKETCASHFTAHTFNSLRNCGFLPCLLINCTIWVNVKLSLDNFTWEIVPSDNEEQMYKLFLTISDSSSSDPFSLMLLINMFLFFQSSFWLMVFPRQY